MKRRWLAISCAIILLVLTGAIGSKWYAARLAADKTAALKARLSPFFVFQHGPATYDLFTGCLRIRDISATGIVGKSVWTFGEMIVKDFDYDNKMPHFAAIAVSRVDVELPQGRLKSLADLLRQYGLQSVEVNAFLDYRYTVSDKTLNIKEIAVEGVGAGRLSASMALSNIEWPMMDNMLAAIMALWQTKLLKAGIQFSDHALCDKVLERLAASSRQTRQEVIDALIGKIAGALRDQQVVSDSDIPGEVSRFLGRPGRLTLSLSPVQPVPLISMRSLPMRDLSRLLKLELKAE